MIRPHPSRGRSSPVKGKSANGGLLLVLGIGRQNLLSERDREADPPSRPLLDRDGATVTFDDSFGNGQAESGRKHQVETTRSGLNSAS